MKFAWSQQALEDVADIQAYLEERNPRAAWKTIETITTEIKALKQFPHMGRPGQVEATREYTLQKLPYSIIYMLETDIVILRVLHNAMQWPPAE